MKIPPSLEATQKSRGSPTLKVHMPTVLITPATLANVDGLYLDLFRKAGFELKFPKRIGLLTEEELLDQLRGVHAVIAGSEPYSPRVFKAHSQLRVIARACVGYDAVDIAAATEHGVAVTIAPNTNQEAVAEQTFALILAVAKSIVQQHLGTVAGKWPRQANLPLR